MKLSIYTDGACSGNPGPGGYSAIIKLEDGTSYELSQGYKNTTNNRMELRAAIAALNFVVDRKKNEVVLYSDSKYITDAVNQGWILNWKNRKLSGVKNPDLWRQFIELIEQFDELSFVWVKGHNGHEENEQCDELARKAIKGVLLDDI